MEESKFIEHTIKQYKYYKTLADKAMVQLDDQEFFLQQNQDVNSVAIIVKHISGNLNSRFHNFKTSDGEKPWRNRDDEFILHNKNRKGLIEMWEHSWQVLFDSLKDLSDTDLSEDVEIRGQLIPIPSALQRSLTHCSYHIGQIIFQAKILKSELWQNLSIPLGKSEEYNSKIRSNHANDDHYTDSIVAK